MADECGFTRVILDLGAAVKPLLKDAIRRGIHSETARRLLQALSPAQEYETQPAAQPASAGGLPLSPRELEVLRLIAAGLSNQAIADRLFLSLRTVKFHTTNIFGKLGVQNRTQAAACARESGLL
ncbi:MAG: response regulator transcription factor [Anaerolineales bacterium]|nr:response regulator transcription factor [Anaerolineales bacterium]